ncbi:MAG: LytTR family transcriptional regulator DNA-binding domain-containing protein [Candidatus Gastranaerophilales bacterium]|nr:LytTR family transcriptional regulator DNA-binding domain-containing protein [Candidatus Gastranaerophilales bacterium]
MIKQVFQNKTHKLLVQYKDEYIPITLENIIYIQSNNKASSIYLENGQVIQSDKPLHYIEKQLKEYPNFQKNHKSYIINIDKVISYKTDRNSVLFLSEINNKKVEIPSSSRYSKKIKNYLDVPTLKNIFPYNRIEKILKHERIKTYDKDLRFFSKEELFKEFGAYSSDNIIKPVYIKNIVWQLYNWIKQGKTHPIEGNIRTIWYSHIKPLFSRLKVLKSGDDNILNSVLVELTYKYNIFKYADLGLADQNKHNWKIGDKNPHIIVFAEKAGHLNSLEKINEQSGISFIALGGQPSHLTTEYFTTALFEKLASSTFIDFKTGVDLYENPTYYLYSIVDWDPAGYFIKQTFIRQLKAKGLENIKTVDLITPESFKPEELDFIKYKLKITGNEISKNKNWIKNTGGVKGESYGIEADALPRFELRKLFFEKAAEHFKEVTSSALAMISDKKILRKLKKLNLISDETDVQYV